MAELWTYSPEQVSILVAGVIPVEGVIEDTFVEIRKVNPTFSSKQSADGGIARVYNSDTTYDISFTVMNSSPTNSTLTMLWQLDAMSRRGKFPLLIRDGSGSSMFFSTSTWIEEIPALTYSADMTVRTWVLKSANGVINIGGNAQRDGLIEGLVGLGLGAVAGFL